MEIAARKRKLELPRKCAVDAEIDLVLDDGAYSLRARLNVSLPGLDPEIARGIVDDAHQTCPYSKAVRGNIDVTVTLI